MWEFMRAQESHRVELREYDEARWTRIEQKLAQLDDIDQRIDKRVAACRSNRALKTEPAIDYVHKAMERQQSLRDSGVFVTKLVAVGAGVTGIIVAIGELLFR